MESWLRLRVAAFDFALVVFFGSVMTGFGYVLVSEQGLPKISLEYLAEADKAFTAGDFELAAEKYRIAASIAPDDDRLLYRLGAALQQAGELTDAITAYRRALRVNPTNKHAHYNLALALLEEGAIDDAVRHNRIALRLDSQYVEAHTNLAAALLRQGHVEEATRHYEMALRLRPGFLPAARALEALKVSSVR
jgi:tetratricopeptide (TPR) repeat protein